MFQDGRVRVRESVTSNSKSNMSIGVGQEDMDTFKELKVFNKKSPECVR